MATGNPLGSYCVLVPSSLLINLLGQATRRISSNRPILNFKYVCLVLWLLCPFGITWSWPEGKRLSVWRTIVSLVAIGSASAIIGWLV